MVRLADGRRGWAAEQVRSEERRLGLRLPPSLREYVAYAHDVTPDGKVGIVHRDCYTLRPIEGQAALSVMVIAEGNVQWAVREADLGRRDPPVHAYHWAEGDETRYVPAEGEGPEAARLSDFVLGFVIAYKPDGGEFGATIPDPRTLRGQLDAALPVRIAGRRGAATYEGDGLLVSLRPDRYRSGFDLTVCVHESVPWERVPPFLWEHARRSHRRGGMFLSESDRQEARRQWGGHPLPAWLGPAPPPLQDLPPGQPGVGQPEKDIPF